LSNKAKMSISIKGLLIIQIFNSVYCLNNQLLSTQILTDILSGKAPLNSSNSGIDKQIQYNKVRPIDLENPSGPINIYMALSLRQIISLDEKNQILTSSFYLMILWSDPRLSWNPSLIVI